MSGDTAAWGAAADGAAVPEVSAVYAGIDVTPGRGEMAAVAAAGPAPPRHELGAVMLTARGAEVYALLIGGNRNLDIAAALCVTENTVETHVRRVLRKLHATSRWDLRERARRPQITENP